MYVRTCVHCTGTLSTALLRIRVCTHQRVRAQVAGGVGLAGSANIGQVAAMFEAVHGSAPDLARDVANPCGMINAAVMMLNYIGQHDQVGGASRASFCARVRVVVSTRCCMRVSIIVL